MPIKQCLLPLALIMFLGFMPREARAYHEDVHFNLTYVLCRLAGLPANDALWIAAADQSMDDNYSTTAYTGNPIGTKLKVDRKYNGLMWHDFCDDGCRSDTKKAVRLYTISFAKSGGGIGATPGDNGVKARTFIKARYKTLLQRAINTSAGSDDNNRIMADIVFGQFLHYEQDFYAHRQFAKNYVKSATLEEYQALELNDDAYWPYGTKWGHAADDDGTTADQVKLRPYLANKMIFDCYSKIQSFAARRSISSPTETEITLAPLIDAIKNAYGPRTLKSKLLGYISYDFPDQENLKNQLSACLANSFPSAWPQSAQLPIYIGGTFWTAHGPLTLPYDDYQKNEELLATWVKKIKDASNQL